MDYLPTLGEKWPHSEGNAGKYSIHGSHTRHFTHFWTPKTPPLPVIIRNSGRLGVGPTWGVWKTKLKC